jgi:chromosome segregation ATPase
MDRRFAIAWALTGIFAAVLAVSFAKIGTELDQVRLQRTDLQFELADLRQELNLLHNRGEHMTNQVASQRSRIEQLMLELDRNRRSEQNVFSAVDSAELTDEVSFISK